MIKDLKDLALRYGYPQRILIFFGITLMSLVIAAIIMGIVTSGGVSTLSLRISTLVQDVMLFILPAVITAVMVTPYPGELLAINRGTSVNLLIIVVLTFVVSLPSMNALVAWNESLTLPAALSGVEQWMRESENAAKGAVEMLLGGTSVGDLVVSILIVGVLAGFSEEIFFRGGLQRLLASGRMSPHAAIWLTAFIFSSFHVQFFGFFPRLLLGAYFGYLLWWSRSIWLPVFAHNLNNSTVVYASWHNRVYGEGEGSGLDTFGAESVWMILLSIMFVALCLIAMKKISDMRVRNNENKY